MTLKAVRLIRENEIIAVPGKTAQDAVAYKIAAAAVPEIAQKTLVPVDMPIVKDRELLRKDHEKAAKLLEEYLDQGKNVVYLTLGDSTIYCTFSYLQHILEEDGYTVELVNGIPSFCAAAARLNLPLTESQVMLMRYYQDMKPGEVADMLNISRSMVRRYLKSAEKHLGKLDF